MLTDAQAETIEALHRAWAGFTEIDAYAAFPARDNTDNAHRRTLTTLAQKGLLRQIGKTSHYIVDWPTLIAAYRDWQRAQS